MKRNDRQKLADGQGVVNRRHNMRAKLNALHPPQPRPATWTHMLLVSDGPSRLAICGKTCRSVSASFTDNIDRVTCPRCLEEVNQPNPTVRSESDGG